MYRLSGTEPYLLHGTRESVHDQLAFSHHSGEPQARERIRPATIARRALARAAAARRCSGSPRIAPVVPCDSTDAFALAESTEPNDPAEPIEKADANEPIEPTDSAEPTDPTDMKEPVEAIDRNESSDHSDSPSTGPSYTRFKHRNGHTK